MSDHFPVLVRLEFGQEGGRNPNFHKFFRVNLDSLEHDSCKGLERIWKDWTRKLPDLTGTSAFTGALAESRAFLQSYGLVHARGRRRRTKRLRSKVQTAAARADRAGWDETLFFELEEARRQLDEQEQEEAAKWKMHAGLK